MELSSFQTLSSHACITLHILPKLITQSRALPLNQIYSASKCHFQSHTPLSIHWYHCTRKTITKQLKNTKILSDKHISLQKNGSCYFVASFIQRHLIPRDQIYETMINSNHPVVPRSWVDKQFSQWYHHQIIEKIFKVSIETFKILFGALDKRQEYLKLFV